MPAISRTVIFDERLYAPTGMVFRWVKGVTRTFGETARTEAPFRTGRLKRGIRWGTRNTGVRQIEGWIKSSAPYTTYVIHGTAYQGRRYIYSTIGWAHKEEVDLIARRVGRGGRAGEGHQGWYMTLPPPGRRFHLRVHGQRKNNFLGRAWVITGRRHKAIRGIRPPI